MEIESNDGSRTRTLLKSGSEVEFGRGLGFKIDDRTVSRRHVSFQLNLSDESTACFQVFGKNPIWVHSRKDGKVSIFRSLERGEMEIGDMFCVSVKNPIWFILREAEFEGENESNLKMDLEMQSELAESSEIRCEMKDGGFLELESIDISHIDPVKEFGFLVLGKEFESYPKKMIRDIKNWDWCIEEPRVDSEDDEFEETRKKAGRRKRKRTCENEDDEWTGESEEEKEQLTKTRKVERPKYSTRSKDRYKPSTKDNGKNAQKKNARSNVKSIDDEEEDEEEDDETLGGFIVENDDLEIDEDEEEEEFEEEEDEEELDD